MLPIHVLASVAALLVIAPAFGQTPARVRGTITSINKDGLTVQERDGRTFKLKTGPFTAYAFVVPSALEAVKVTDFVGSAVKGPLGAFVAVELAIIPENMRAGRIALYEWDPLPDPAAETFSAVTATSMTNGLVSNVSPTLPTFTDTNMISGAVSDERVDRVGITLTVTYDGGRKDFQIAVPPNAPIVRYVLSDKSAATIGSSVMIKTNPGDQASLVTVGKGVTPPM